MQYTYEATLTASQKVDWQIEDLIGGDKQLDFTKPFLPESLARVQALPFLTAREQRLLNQIRGHGYLCTFGLVEEFILPFVLDHVRPSLQDDDFRVRALLQFAGEEAKHIQLFKRFRAEFERGFGTSCGVIGPADAIAKAVLAHEPLAVALAILHIEWMTQRHWVESARDDQQLDEQFKSLLRHHWMEEAQHAKLDTLIVEALAATLQPAEIEASVGGYLSIGGFLDQGLQQQVALDLDAFERASGRTLDQGERTEFTRVQLQANRWTYLGTGMTHPQLLATVERIHAPSRSHLEQVAPAFC